MPDTGLVTKGYPKIFWYFVVVEALIAAGYADFSLMAFHFKRTALLKDDWIPLFYAVAMFSEGLSALLLGKIYDKIGITIMVFTTFFSLFFAPLVFGLPHYFAGGFGWALAGIILWGIGMGAQESLLKAAVADVIPVEKRGMGFGVFNTAFGIFWFIGSVIMGRLYDLSITWLVGFSMILQAIALLALLFVTFKHSKRFS
jgi:MFS family permease